MNNTTENIDQPSSKTYCPTEQAFKAKLESNAGLGGSPHSLKQGQDSGDWNTRPSESDSTAGPALENRNGHSDEHPEPKGFSQTYQLMKDESGVGALLFDKKEKALKVEKDLFSENFGDLAVSGEFEEEEKNVGNQQQIQQAAKKVQLDLKVSPCQRRIPSSEANLFQEDQNVDDYRSPAASKFKDQSRSESFYTARSHFEDSPAELEDQSDSESFYSAISQFDDLGLNFVFSTDVSEGFFEPERELHHEGSDHESFLSD